MSLQSILDLSASRGRKIGLSEERLRNCLPEVRNAIAFYREYPDLLVDLYAEGTKFKLYFYQRVFLRACMRHKNAYAVYPRA